MAAGGLELDLAGFGLNRARGGAGQVWGEARELGARRIRAGRRGTAGGASDGALLVLCLRELEEGDEGKGMAGKRSFQGVREDKGGARRARFAGMLDAWRARRRPQQRYGVGAAQEKHWRAQ